MDGQGRQLGAAQVSAGEAAKLSLLDSDTAATACGGATTDIFASFATTGATKDTPVSLPFLRPVPQLQATATAAAAAPDDISDECQQQTPKTMAQPKAKAEPKMQPKAKLEPKTTPKAKLEPRTKEKAGTTPPQQQRSLLSYFSPRKVAAPPQPRADKLREQCSDSEGDFSCGDPDADAQVAASLVPVVADDDDLVVVSSGEPPVDVIPASPGCDRPSAKAEPPVLCGNKSTANCATGEAESTTVQAELTPVKADPAAAAPADGESKSRGTDLLCAVSDIPTVSVDADRPLAVAAPSLVDDEQDPFSSQQGDVFTIAAREGKKREEQDDEEEDIPPPPKADFAADDEFGEFICANFSIAAPTASVTATATDTEAAGVAVHHSDDDAFASWLREEDEAQRALSEKQVEDDYQLALRLQDNHSSDESS
eukprot:TRINITY_DN200_c0_g2_i2.p2 TRINITY_DN200_c0_g2~~TRINITY_DN200_c0_g2_i2.p2  ORF type:complete len:426 (+),score=127.58 TRINITY_DN200_c0_g2_i2:1856-3133(+)